MAFPDFASTVSLLGYRMKDRITGLTGVVTTISFDLYGCVQAVIHSGLDKDGKIMDQHWFDIARLEPVESERVMMPPPFGPVLPSAYDSGPAAKPTPRAV